MSKQNKEKKSTPNPFNQPRKPQGGGGFNFYCIYAVLIILLLSVNLFSWQSSAKEITEQQFYKELVNQGHVKRVEVINKSVAEIYIKSEYLNTPYHRKNKVGKEG